MTIPEGFGQAAYNFTGNQAPNGAVVTMGFENVSDMTPSECAEALANAWVGTFIPLQSTSITLSFVRVKLGPDATGPFVDFPVGEQGDASSDAFTPQVAILMKKGTLLGGRAHQGRMFVPGAIEDAITANGQLSSATLTAWASAGDAYLDALTAFSVPGRLLHTNALLDPDPIFTLTPVTLSATIQRRLRP